MFRRLWNKIKPDQAVRGEIEKRIAENRFLREHSIEVSVKDGRVRLFGYVPTPMARDLLFDTVKEVPGVQAVDDELTIGIPPSVGRMDMEHDRGLNMAQPGEVRAAEPEDNITLDEIIPVSVPVTGEEMRVLDDQTVQDMITLGAITEEGKMAAQVVKDMLVVDRENNRVGKVKEVRPSDFLLNRSWQRDVYVPYVECEFDGEKVVLHVLKNEVDDQGWANPQ